MGELTWFDRIRLRPTFNRSFLIWLVTVGGLRSLPAQTTHPWHVALGVGATAHEPISHGVVFSGEVGRRLYANSRMTLAVRLAGARLEPDHFVCLTSSEPCDLRELSTVADVGLGVSGWLSASPNAPYFTATTGTWIGRNSEVAPGQRPGGNGFMLAGEGGYRVSRFELGLAGKQFQGAVRGRVTVLSIVVRANF